MGAVVGAAGKGERRTERAEAEEGHSPVSLVVVAVAAVAEPLLGVSVSVAHRCSF